MMIVLISQTEKFLGVETLNQETVNYAARPTRRAEPAKEDVGSVFTPVRVNTPLDLPYATVTVLFRPFPWEAHNGAGARDVASRACSSSCLTIKGRRRLLAIPRALRREPYIAYCLGITLTFVYAFSSFSNFGILARQRCQVMPFFLALICLNEVKKRQRGRPESDAARDIEALAPPAENPYDRFEPKPDDE